MTNIDLSGVFDDCYPDYEDLTAEITLHYDRQQRCWENDQVEIWKDDEFGWCIRPRGEKWSYGFDSLHDAVKRYTGMIAQRQREDGTFCSSRTLSEDYRQRVDSDELYCRVTRRCFLPVCSETLLEKKCEALTYGINMAMGV